MKHLMREFKRQADLVMNILFASLLAGFGFSLGAIICIGLLGRFAS